MSRRPSGHGEAGVRPMTPRHRRRRGGHDRFRRQRDANALSRFTRAADAKRERQNLSTSGGFKPEPEGGGK